MIKLKKPQFYGPAMALASALLFSFGGVLIKFLPWHPLSINSLRNMVALIITIIYITKIRHRLKFNRWILLSGMAMMLTSTLFCVANSMTTAANAILLQYSSPLFIILFSYFAFKIKPKKLDISMCFAVLIGISFFFFDSLATGNTLGDLFALISGCTYAMVFMANILPRGDALSAFLLGELLASIVGLPFLVQETDFSSPIILGCIGLGIIIGGGFVILAVALRHVRPVTANLLGTIEPILNPVWVAIFYGEIITPLAMVGFFIVIASVVMYNILSSNKYNRNNS